MGLSVQWRDCAVMLSLMLEIKLLFVNERNSNTDFFPLTNDQRSQDNNVVCLLSGLLLDHALWD